MKQAGKVTGIQAKKKQERRLPKDQNAPGEAHEQKSDENVFW